MSRISRPALLVAAVSLTAGLFGVPGAAHAAATTTALTRAEMTAALKAVAAASTTAAAGGWRAEMEYGGFFAGSGLFVVDPAGGAGLFKLEMDGESERGFVAAGRGGWESVSDDRSRAALTMMGRPAVQYVFRADKALTVKDLEETLPTPAGMLTQLGAYPGSRTLHDNGTVDYAFNVNSHQKIAVHVSAAGLLDRTEMTVPGVGQTMTYTYGRQRVVPPAAELTIDAAGLAGGIAYLDMPDWVQTAAQTGATDTRRAAQGRTVKVSTLRKLVRRDAAQTNAKVEASLVKVKDITGGVRVYATNPWTRQTVRYTVKASGRKVVVTKA